jgi:hypothetical protein
VGDSHDGAHLVGGPWHYDQVRPVFGECAVKGMTDQILLREKDGILPSGLLQFCDDSLIKHHNPSSLFYRFPDDLGDVKNPHAYPLLATGIGQGALTLLAG